MHHLARRLATAIVLGSLAATVFAGSAVGVDKWVTMFDSEFLPPGPTRIEPGDTVTWVNDDDLPHDAAGDGWSTPLLTKGDSASVVFTAPGTYAYVCTIHPEMTGSVVVRAASGGAGPTDPPTDTVGLPISREGTGAGEPLAPVVVVLGASIAAFALIARRGSRRA